MLSTFDSLWSRRNLLRVLTRTNLQLIHGRTVLGSLWWLLDPLMMTGVYTIVVGFIRGQGGLHDPYPAFLLCGLIAWKAFSQSITQAITALARNEGLINSFSFPKAVIPLSLVFSTHILLVFAFWPLLLVVLFYEYVMSIASIHLGLTVLFLPLLVLTQLSLALGGALFLSALGAFFKDLENIMTHLLQALMFLSPCLYSIVDVMPDYKGLASVQWSGLRTIYVLNPMAHVLDGYRQAILYGRCPDLVGVFFALTIGVVTTLWGLSYFRSQERRFAKVI